MDSVTQAVLGAAIGESLLGKKIGNKGALLGAAIATIPDLDVLFYMFYDSFDMLSIHRGLSHSILFSVLAGWLIAFVLSKMKLVESVSFNHLFLFTWLCLFTHILLDTFTAYGTELFLPFSDTRLGFDSVNVVDPFYTIPMIVGLVLSLWVFKINPKRPKYNNWGLIISSAYLLFTLINKQFVTTTIESNMANHDIEYFDMMTMPVGIANVNWYGVAKSKDSIYLQQYSILNSKSEVIEGFAINEHLLDKVDQKVADKMRWFAKGYYTLEEVKGKIRMYNLQVDMRGIVNLGDRKAPTAGYFELYNIDGKTYFSSGSIKSK